MLDTQTMTTLTILCHYQEISLYDLTVKTRYSRQTVDKHIKEINAVLLVNGYPQVELEDERYLLPKQLQGQFEEILGLFQPQQVYLSQAERLNIIYLYTFSRQGFLSNNHYQDLLQVSRNTALADVRELRKRAEGFGVRLDYSRGQGYTLSGSEANKHRLALYSVSNLLHASTGSWAMERIFSELGVSNHFQGLNKRLRESYHSCGLVPIQDYLDSLIYFFQFLMLRYQRQVTLVDKDQLEPGSVFSKLARDLLEELEVLFQIDGDLVREQESYFSLLLLTCFEGGRDGDDEFFNHLTQDIIDEMETVALISFEKKAELFEGLKKHLIPAYYRIKYNVTNVNAYTDFIKRDYEDLYYLVAKALYPLEKNLGLPIPDSEISYFTIHFGGYIKKLDRRAKPYRALIICPNGVSSSLIIKEDLKALFSNISFRGAGQYKGREDFNSSDYQMIFSTVEVDSDKPSYLVPLMMDNEQKQNLFQQVIKDFPKAGTYPMAVEQLINRITPYITILDRQGLKQAVTEFLSLSPQYRKEVRPLLHELLTEETYQSSREQLSWKEAIYLAGQPLVASQKVEETYLKAMVSKVEEFGPFIDLGRGIAIPHARPEDGVKSVGMSILVLEHPIYLLDDPKHEIRVLICLAAVDNESHLKALSYLTKILREEDNIKALQSSKTYDDIREIIQQED